MESIEEINAWLQENYPDMRCRKLREGAWCVEQMVDVVEHMPLDFSYEYDGFGYKVQAATLIFDVKNRLPGAWVCDEITKRDPRLAANEGNFFHEAYKASFAAEEEHKQMINDQRVSATNMWETARRNPALMERITEKLARGDTEGACKELSPETMFKHALRESPKELRTKDYWRSI
jgi:hypothetical protein